MSKRTLGIVCAIFIGLLSDGTRASAEPEADVLSWLPQPAPGEDAVVVRRNAVMNKMAEARNNRVTIVKFDDDIETKCPILTTLFFAAGNKLEWVTPNFNLNDAARTTVYFEGSGPEEKSVDFVIENAACRYVLTVKRYDRDGDSEKEVPVKYIPKISRGWVFKSFPENHQKIGLAEDVVTFISPSKELNFTGITFFAPTTFTVFLANVEKDQTLASESNLLTRTYKVEIKNAQAALRISINREIYSNGQWVNAFNKPPG